MDEIIVNFGERQLVIGDDGVWIADDADETTYMSLATAHAIAEKIIQHVKPRTSFEIVP